MIDTVSLVWNHQRGREIDRIEKPQSGRTVRGPADLDLRGVVVPEEVGARLGVEDGNGRLRREVYPETGDRLHGRWNVGQHIELLVSDRGRVELRLSLPYLAVGRNDVVLTGVETRHALLRAAMLARDLVACDLLTVENAKLTRADHCWQFVVPDVSRAIAGLRKAFQPGRKTRTDFTPPGRALSGPSVIWGYGSTEVIRLYDKGLERAAAGDLVPERLHNRILRAELQQRKGYALEAVRAAGYTDEVLQLGLKIFERCEWEEPAAIAGTLAERRDAVFARYLADHPEELESMRHQPEISRAAWYRWRKLARNAAVEQLQGFRLVPPANAAETGMAPFREPELADCYPTLEEVMDHERELDRKRRETISKARADHQALIERQTRYPTEDELARYSRERKLARETAANDLLVASYYRDQRRAADAAYTEVMRLEQEQRGREASQRLFDEYAVPTASKLARDIERGRVPAAAMPWN